MIHRFVLRKYPVIIALVLFSSAVFAGRWFGEKPVAAVPHTQQRELYWFILHRASNIEKLYKGEPGNEQESTLIKTFRVKAGIPGDRPTPLPQFVGREYWLVVDKMDTRENPETAPYFLTLDVPVSEEEPYGPVPYLECSGQCNWQLPGPFGLHGVASDESRLAAENPGSSGCIRHTDKDITYLYNLLNPQEEIRYYIRDI